MARWPHDHPESRPERARWFGFQSRRLLGTLGSALSLPIKASKLFLLISSFAIWQVPHGLYTRPTGGHSSTTKRASTQCTRQIAQAYVGRFNAHGIVLRCVEVAGIGWSYLIELWRIWPSVMRHSLVRLASTWLGLSWAQLISPRFTSRCADEGSTVFQGPHRCASRERAASN